MDIEEVIEFLAETDEPAGSLQAGIKAAERKLKIVQAKAMLEQVGRDGTVAEKEARARTSHDYLEIHELLVDLEKEYYPLLNQRNTMQLRFEYWRSVNANRRQANIT